MNRSGSTSFRHCTCETALRRNARLPSDSLAAVRLSRGAKLDWNETLRVRNQPGIGRIESASEFRGRQILEED